MSAWLDLGDKLGSIVGALASVIALVVPAVVVTARRRRRVAPARPGFLLALRRAQEHDTGRQQRYRFFELVRPPDLAEVYVRQQVTGVATSEAPVRVDAMLAGRNHTLLLGGAGAGKSALVATVVAEEARAAIVEHRRVVTVAVAAADLVGQTVPAALARTCRDILEMKESVPDFNEPPTRGGHWRVMIDGIDEVIDPHARSLLLSSLHNWLDGPPTPRRLVITTRPLPDDEMASLRRPGVDSFELQPFDREDLDAFAQRWFAARNPDRLDIASELAVRFVARVASARLGPVARVPLLSTIAALVFEHDTEQPLPSSRTALYEKFVSHLLHGRNELRHLREAIDTALTGGGRAAAEVAAWMHRDFPSVVGSLLDALGESYVRDPHADLLSEALAALHRDSGCDLGAVVPDGPRLIRDLLLATGVITARGRRLRFIHQSFAEFFAARCSVPTFDEAGWRRLMANPGARSLAAFMAANRPDPDRDRLISGLLDDGADPVAAGDLLADGVRVDTTTRHRVVDALIAAVPAGANRSEALRVLRELSVDADVVTRLSDLALDESADDWTRLAVIGAVVEVDRRRGARLLREVAAQVTDPDAREWAEEFQYAYGVSARPLEWQGRRASGERRPLGVFGRGALSDRVADPHIGDRERVDAALRLADDGEPGALRGLLATPGINDNSRLRAAKALADRGDDSALLAFAEGSPSSDYYVVESQFGHSLAYGALVELHRLGHPSVAELLTAFVARSNVPCTYGAAAMLAERGRYGALVDLVRRGRTQPELAAAAARHLAQHADGPTLRDASQRASSRKVQDWLAAGPARSRRPSWPLFSAAERLDWYAIRAAHGLDRDARMHLRGQAAWAWSTRRRRRALVALAAVGESEALDRLRRNARNGLRAGTRLHAAAALGRLDLDKDWRSLRQLTAAHGRSLRLKASIRLARETGDLGPLANLVTDDGAPTRYRVRAADSIGYHVVGAGLDVAEGFYQEYPPSGPAIYIRDTDDRYGQSAVNVLPVGVWRKLPPPCSAALEALAEAGTKDTRLLLALADVGLPREKARDLLASLAQDSDRSVWHRARAARTLIGSADPRGEDALRSMAGDRDIARLFRWFILLSDESEWEEFDRHIGRCRRIFEGSRLLLIPRLLRLFLTRPDPADR